VHDVWLFQAVMDTRVCDLCRKYETANEWNGNGLRSEFPYLRILDENTIGGPGSDGDGLVHPNCRCRLVRSIGYEKPQPKFDVTIDLEVKNPESTKRKLTRLVGVLPEAHTEDIMKGFRVVKKSPYRNYGEYDGVEIRIREDILGEEHARHVIYHEVGHHVWYDDLTYDDRAKWRRIWYRAPMPTDYAKNAPRNQVEEGFAECYSIFYNKSSKFKINIEVERFIEEVKDRRG